MEKVTSEFKMIRVPESESGLIRRCKLGDREAFSSLLILHGEKIQRIAARMSCNKRMREDILQEVAKQVLLNIHAFRGDSSLSTWLYRITVNKALEMLKEEKRYNGGILHEESIVHNGEAFAFQRNEIRRIVLNCLASLPAQQRKCASLFYYAEMSLAEIAETLSLREGSVKTALFKARKNLTLQLRKRGILECG